MTSGRDGHRLRARTVVVCVLSAVWSTALTGSALVVGLVSGSVALVAFGAESGVDAVGSGVLVWLFSSDAASSRVEGAERTTARVLGSILLAVGAYIAVHAGYVLATGASPERTPAGVVIAATSLLVLPALAVAKLRLARALEHPALRADGMLTAVGAILAIAVLLGLALDEALHWWWTDPVAALVVAVGLLRESWIALRMP